MVNDGVVTSRRYLRKIKPDEMATVLQRGPTVKAVKRPICNVCGDTVLVVPVNVSSCTNVGGPWKSALACRNSDCKNVELSTKTVAQWRVS